MHIITYNARPVVAAPDAAQSPESAVPGGGSAGLDQRLRPARPLPMSRRPVPVQNRQPARQRP